jgi:hypothetical protein
MSRTNKEAIVAEFFEMKTELIRQGNKAATPTANALAGLNLPNDPFPLENADHVAAMLMFVRELRWYGGLREASRA